MGNICICFSLQDVKKGVIGYFRSNTSVEYENFKKVRIDSGRNGSVWLYDHSLCRCTHTHAHIPILGCYDASG